ncbi:hypothetical protein [Pseudaminobacter sp. NGMCC 1.201702]|uniref:hypothetical protein n=1 Tax=Pseudaminobacter sp. NGMCC 1.201702 TaxID=3391825 RepID=UPI0039EE2883
MLWKVLGALVLTASLPAESGDMQANCHRTYSHVERSGGDLTDLPKFTPDAKTVAFVRPAEQVSTSTVSLDCGDAYDEADIASEELAVSAERLRRCAEDMDIAGDGCAREIDRVLADQSQFERAMAAVGDKCE